MHPKAWFVGHAWRLLVLAVAAVALAHPAGAQSPRFGFDHFRHDRWMVYEGAPAGARGIAQTPDGWIWIAGSDGLYRFDGVSFERIPAPPGSPLENAAAGPMRVARSGELWAGFNQGAGVAAYRRGRLVRIPMTGAPAGISSIGQTPDGAMWLSANNFSYDAKRLYRYFRGRWTDADAAFKLPEGYPSDICISKDGTLWLTLKRQFAVALAYLRPGSAHFETSAMTLPRFGCDTDQLGRVWVTADNNVQVRIGEDGRTFTRPLRGPGWQRDLYAIVGADRRGGLWGFANTQGLVYAPGPALGQNEPLAHFAKADGLSSDIVRKLMIDREDNVWVTTDQGIDRFRRASAVLEPLVETNFGYALGIMQNGSDVYIDAISGLYQVSPGPPRRVLKESPDGQCRARGKGGWVIYSQSILRFDGEARRRIPGPRGVTMTSPCVEDSRGRLWVGTVTGELRWYDSDGWHVPSRSMPKVHLSNILTGPTGDLAYTSEHELIQVIGDRLIVAPLDIFRPGTITSLSVQGDSFYISGSEGLLRIRGNRVRRIGWRRFPWLSRLRDLIRTPGGETWLMRENYISRVATADLDRAFDDPGAPLYREALDARDGLRPIQPSDCPGPQLAVGADGRIWQLNREGVSVIDPPPLFRKTTPPPVVIRALVSGGERYRDPARVTLGPGTRVLDIDYTALSYAYPERLRFRYRLEGVDDGWIDAGSRRLASYANLGPGTYHFRLIASDNQRDWSSPGAALDIVIAPTFLQSWPFKLLCALAALGLLWLAYSLRLRAVSGRLRMAMAERTAERERIARELHDTLLQGIQGLMLRFQVVADRIEDPGTRRSLDDALGQADMVVVEGRERVRDLRSAGAPGELARELARLARSIVADETWRIDLCLEGEERPLRPLVRFEALCIAEEAIRNAVLHAGPGPISLSLGYDRKQFRLGVRDGGSGIPEAVLSEGSRAGHFGLVGMRERARRIGGQLAIITAEGEGTEIALAVPARAAYPGRRRSRPESLRAIAKHWRLR